MTEEQALAELTKLAELGPDEYFHRAENKEIVAETMVWLRVVLHKYRQQTSQFAIVLRHGSQYMAFDSEMEALQFAEEKNLKGCHLMYIQKIKKGVITHD
ncbi:MAG: hypothetical protein CVU86_07070 [Firmicutes bacterium HGW-Firmicutes-11]|jgi:hypothetical protein|nr:MAG: hypothetical protein CVU94_00735 [Firmicutes bacterium HGW-Firmicutes-19]PKM84486.1 MAG: hypothetical protein CVU86_07070 [Firmicutes bacterium HGW-Firmicutes-11]